MRAFHGAPADVQRGAHNLIYSQRLGSNRGADDVHHRVHRPNFVEVHLLNVGVMNLGFRRTQRLEDSNRCALCTMADAGLTDDPAYLFQAAAMPTLLPAAVNDPQDDVSSPVFGAYRREATAAECLDGAIELLTGEAGRALDAAWRQPAPPVRDPLQRVRAARKGPDPA